MDGHMTQREYIRLVRGTTRLLPQK